MNQEHDASTRKVLLTMLKTQGPMTVNDMSKQLGITEMAVRRHLNTLEKDGLLETKLVRQAMGRPSHTYLLTAASDDLFPKKYQHLTLDLLGELAAVAGEEQVDQLFDRRKDRLIERYTDQTEGKPLPERIQALADIQNANGYMVEWEQPEEGMFVFREHNCPIAQVAQQYQHACSCELAMFRKLLDAEVERTECLAKGGARCTYIIHGNK
ncbi:transcriptional regulator [Paenibacillus filicis]|uniref:Transcriptional regulator n=1 Tax=Paenibacillus gyeongsangnamensis TaxID=3388067 RepID=A0ABT4Q5D2_9BACL|nr:metalloregulator ArsR/SmtB family transcription factor [Paenibacillus filicis]MCZ8512002.1 transcriptional regulator [Paenibacillus filicis]